MSRTDMPMVRRNSSMSARISACTVTSSAVVGSSATRSCGRQGDGAGDDDPLAHAAGEGVRIIKSAARGGGDAHEVEHSHGLAPRRGPIHPAMRDEDLSDLVADRHGRIERGRRVLHDVAARAGHGRGRSPLRPAPSVRLPPTDKSRAVTW